MQADSLAGGRSSSGCLEFSGQFPLASLPCADAPTSHIIGSTTMPTSSATLLHHPLVQLAVSASNGSTTLYSLQLRQRDLSLGKLAVEILPTLVASVRQLDGGGLKSGSLPASQWISGGRRQVTAGGSVNVAPDTEVQQGDQAALSGCGRFLATSCTAKGVIGCTPIARHSNSAAI